MSVAAEAFISATDKQVSELLKKGAVWEVKT